jgi:protein arginine N-methyltransferase 1
VTTAEAQLTPDTGLLLVSGIRTRSDASGHVLVGTPVGTTVDAGPSGYAILAMFSSPRTLGDAVAELEGRLGGKQGFMPTAGVIMALIETGVLVDPYGQAELRSGWADPVEHARMLHDHARTDSFLAAVASVVRLGDVVLDIGTGSGVLAVAAARAGARRVYAIEASDIASVAHRVFEANDVQTA